MREFVALPPWNYGGSWIPLGKMPVSHNPLLELNNSGKHHLKSPKTYTGP
jgi:hypothetical protein